MLLDPRTSSVHAPALRARALPLALLAAACTSGLGGFDPEPEGSAESSSETGLGLDLGFVLPSPVEGRPAIAGARIAIGDGSAHRDVAFVAIVTATPADDVDGLGTPLVRDAQPPADGNGLPDVFLLAIEDELVVDEDERLQPVAFSRALVNTFRHSRCMNCHGLGSATPPGEEEVFPEGHPGPPAPVVTKTCNTCHSPQNVPGLEGVEWRAPLEADGDFDFRGLSVAELNERASSIDIHEHLLADGRVRWAIEVGNVPFVPPQAGGNAGTSPQWEGSGRDRGAVPISFATFQAQLEAWAGAGFPATAAGSVRDVLLVSQAAGAAQAADAASFAPSIAWVPEPAYTPGSTGVPAGRVLVAFASEASDLGADGNATRDVFVVAVEVFVGRDPATGAVLEGGLDLALAASAPVLVSAAQGGGGGDADSDAPAIDGEGTLVAFESRATNLVPGFVPGAADVADVYLRDLALGQSLLVSASAASPAQGGDGGSGEAALAARGGVVAFSSAATDLVGDDLNGLRDVFWTRYSGGALEPLARASLRSDGFEGTGGDCRAPSVAVTQDRVSIVFESDKSDLDSVPLASTTNVYLREGAATTLLSQRRTGAAASGGSGDSRAPRISPTGACVVYESEAPDLDAVFREDGNGVADVLLVDLSRLRAFGTVEGRRVSLDSMRRDAEGPSRAPAIASFRDALGSFDTQSFALLRSAAEELGASDSTDLVAFFLTGEDVAAVTDFAVAPAAGPAPLEVQFTDLSTGEPLSWEWDFGDGGTSVEQHPVHVYQIPGEWDVRLRVGRAGGEEFAEKIAAVRSLEPLVVDFSGNDLQGPVPHTVTFTSTVGGDLEGIEYLWDFGNGQSSTKANPVHVYEAVGTYDVTLSVSGLAGADQEAKQGYVTVTEATGANFTFDTSTGLRVQFSDASSGDPTSWSWDFGDEGSSSEQDPQHVFPATGPYQVVLSVDGPGGPSSIEKQVVVVAETFDSVYAMLGTCFGCHGSSGGLDLGTSEDFAYMELLGNGTGAAAEGPCCPGEKRVVPFDALSSLLYQVLDPTIDACNSPIQCPSTGADMGGVSDLDLLRRWIDQGAARD